MARRSGLNDASYSVYMTEPPLVDATLDFTRSTPPHQYGSKIRLSHPLLTDRAFMYGLIEIRLASVARECEPQGYRLAGKSSARLVVESSSGYTQERDVTPETMPDAGDWAAALCHSIETEWASDTYTLWHFLFGKKPGGEYVSSGRTATVWLFVVAQVQKPLRVRAVTF